MIGIGVPLAIVGKTLGHQNLATTQRHYVRVDEVTLDEVRRRIKDLNTQCVKTYTKAAARRFTATRRGVTLRGVYMVLNSTRADKLSKLTREIKSCRVVLVRWDRRFCVEGFGA
jgi:hypothetical protein